MDARLNYVENPGSAKAVKHFISAGRPCMAARCRTPPCTWWRSAPARSTGARFAWTCTPKMLLPRGNPPCGSTWSRCGARPPSSARQSAPPWNSPSRARAWPTPAEGVTDEAWANAAKHYDTDELATLVAAIASINAWNRLNAITRQPAGDYQPGQWS